MDRMNETTRPTQRVAELLIRWRRVLFVLAIVLTAAGAWPSTQLLFDAAITNLFPTDDPVLVAYKESLDLFGGA